MADRTPEAFPEHLLGLLHVPRPDDRRCTAEDTFVAGWYAALDAVRALIRQEDTKSLIREMTASRLVTASRTDRQPPTSVADAKGGHGPAAGA